MARLHNSIMMSRLRIGQSEFDRQSNEHYFISFHVVFFFGWSDIALVCVPAAPMPCDEIPSAWKVYQCLDEGILVPG